MPSISKWTIDLVTKTASFTKGLKGARRGAKGFGGSITRLVSGPLARLGATLTGLAGAGAFGLLIKRQAAFLDEMGKTSDRLGIMVGELAGLQVAARRSGVDVKTLGLALQRMTRRISEAAKGTGESVAALRELGLSALRLNAMSPDEAFREIAEAMSKVKNQADRVRLAFKLFDSEGVKLLNTLRGGKDALLAARAEAERFGSALTRLDVAKVESMNDAVGDMKESWAGLGKTLAVAVAPRVEEMAQGLAAMVQAVTRLAGSKGIPGILGDDSARRETQKELLGISQQLSRQRKIVRRMRDWQRKVKGKGILEELLPRYAAGEEKALLKIGALLQEQAVLRRQLNTASKEAATTSADAWGALTSVFSRLKEDGKAIGQNIKDWVSPMLDASRVLNSAAKELRDMGKSSRQVMLEALGAPAFFMTKLAGIEAQIASKREAMNAIPTRSGLGEQIVREFSHIVFAKPGEIDSRAGRKEDRGRTEARKVTLLEQIAGHLAVIRELSGFGPSIGIE